MIKNGSSDKDLTMYILCKVLLKNTKLKKQQTNKNEKKIIIWLILFKNKTNKYMYTFEWTQFSNGLLWSGQFLESIERFVEIIIIVIIY